MSTIDNSANKLLITSCGSFVFAVTGAKLEKINLGFISFKDVSLFSELALVALVVYLTWSYFHAWQENVKPVWNDNIEKFYCKFLTNIFIEKLKKEGSAFCNYYVPEAYPSNKYYSAESSWFLYEPGFTKGFGKKRLKVLIQKKNDYGGFDKVGHAVHTFKEAKLNKQTVSFWLSWGFRESAFRLHIMPYVFSGLAIVALTFRAVSS